MHKKDSALNELKWLICHKIKPKKINSNERWLRITNERAGDTMDSGGVKKSYIYIYIYDVHTISFQTFFVWALLLIVHT